MGPITLEIQNLFKRDFTIPSRSSNPGVNAWGRESVERSISSIRCSIKSANEDQILEDNKVRYHLRHQVSQIAGPKNEPRSHPFARVVLTCWQSAGQARRLNNNRLFPSPHRRVFFDYLPDCIDRVQSCFITCLYQLVSAASLIPTNVSYLWND